MPQQNAEMVGFNCNVLRQFMDDHAATLERFNGVKEYLEDYSISIVGVLGNSI